MFMPLARSPFDDKEHGKRLGLPPNARTDSAEGTVIRAQSLPLNRLAMRPNDRVV